MPEFPKAQSPEKDLSCVININSKELLSKNYIIMLRLIPSTYISGSNLQKTYNGTSSRKSKKSGPSADMRNPRHPSTPG